MNKQPIEQAQDADLRLSVAAMQRAARHARELARRTGTYLVVSQDGKVIYLHPDQWISGHPPPDLAIRLLRKNAGVKMWNGDLRVTINHTNFSCKRPMAGSIPTSCASCPARRIEPESSSPWNTRAPTAGPPPRMTG